MAQIDAKHSGITKNDPESVLRRLKSPVLVFSGRYRDGSIFFFAADCHFYLYSFHFWLLPRRLTQSAFTKTASTTCHIAIELQADMLNKFMYMQACLARNYPEALSHCGHGHDLTLVAQLSVINIADFRSAFNKTLASERFRRNAVNGVL